MWNNKPDTLPFERAIQRLEDGLARYQSDTTDALIRDALIYRFKLTYELGHKILKRYLKYVSANPEQLDRMTFQDLIRTANEQNLLLSEWIDWRGFREMRVKASYSFNEDVSLEVIAAIPRFIEETAYLRDQLGIALSDQDDSMSYSPS